MITQAERDYVVDLFFTVSPYAKDSKNKEEIVDDFLFETMNLRGFLLEINRNYSIKDFTEEIKKFYNGQSCLEDKEGNIRVKTDRNWETDMSLRADVIFLNYIAETYNIQVVKTHTLYKILRNN